MPQPSQHLLAHTDKAASGPYHSHPYHSHPYKYGWQHFRRPIATQVPRSWQHWLYDDGSLTKRLIKLSNNQFVVRVLRNTWGVPRADERRLLGLKCRQGAIIREVELLGEGNAWVAARSIIPMQTLCGRQRLLRNIGTRPLGALLFSHPTMRRGPIEVTSLKNAFPNSTFSNNTFNAGQKHWARRSVFYLDNRPLLVSETFASVLQG